LEFLVPRLAVPENSAGISCFEIEKYDAVRLFVERARAIKSGFALTEKNVGSVAEICRRLDGLPLAIELAAARVRMIPPQSILERLEDRLKLLIGGASDLPARQQTVSGTIEWSYDLLGEDEKLLFRCLAVFAGGFTIKAAEAVCGSDSLKTEVLDVMTSLVDNSLLVPKDRFDDEPAFRMLQVVREYALQAFESDRDMDGAVRRRHAEYFLALGEEAEGFLQTAKAGEWLDRLEDEHDNLRAAIDWLFQNDVEKGTRLAAAIRIYLINRSHLSEGREWLTTALERSQEMLAAVRFKLLNGLGFLAIVQGDFEAARKFFEEDLAEGRKTGDKKRTAESLRGLAGALHGKGDYTAARTFQEEGLAIHREINDKFGIAKSLNGLGSLAHTEGDTATARRLFEESLTIFSQLGNESGICYCLMNLGEVAYNSGDYEAAREYYRQVVTIAQNIGYKDRISFCLDAFAAIATVQKEWKMAAQLAGAAEQLRKSIGCGEDSSDRHFRQKFLDKVRGALGETAFSAAEEQGRKLRLDEAIRLALFT
jgi:non-specific serine/threonine protein kinase